VIGPGTDRAGSYGRMWSTGLDVTAGAFPSEPSGMYHCDGGERMSHLGGRVSRAVSRCPPVFRMPPLAENPSRQASAKRKLPANLRSIGPTESVICGSYPAGSAVWPRAARRRINSIVPSPSPAPPREPRPNARRVRQPVWIWKSARLPCRWPRVAPAESRGLPVR
jgi:hypothetical protein